MEIYRVELRFDPKTGMKLGEVKVPSTIRCDFTGKDLGDGDLYYGHYQILYYSQDACYGASEEEFEFGKEFDVDMGDFLCKPYVFLNDWQTGENAEKNMLTQMPADGLETFSEACRYYRVLTARKLIEDGVITPDEIK